VREAIVGDTDYIDIMTYPDPLRERRLLLDHLVYATPDIAATMKEIGSRFGVNPAVGGKHAAWGTMNALLSLGPKMYLEIMGPDPEEPHPQDRRPFSIDALTHPRLVTWAARSGDLQVIKGAALAEGVDLGEIQERSRQRPDGFLLKWLMTDLTKARENGIVPFFINWGDSPHPEEGAPKGCVLKRLGAVHPEAERLTRVLKRMGLELVVEQGPTARLMATIETPRGTVKIE
jgi:Glyoxalase-like domain